MCVLGLAKSRVTSLICYAPFLQLFMCRSLQKGHFHIFALVAQSICTTSCCSPHTYTLYTFAEMKKNDLLFSFSHIHTVPLQSSPFITLYSFSLTRKHAPTWKPAVLKVTVRGLESSKIVCLCSVIRC